MDKNGFFLNTPMKRYKYICIVVHVIPKHFTEKDNLHRLVQNTQIYDLPQTGKYELLAEQTLEKM